jgi:hypothetical protein
MKGRRDDVVLTGKIKTIEGHFDFTSTKRGRVVDGDAQHDGVAIRVAAARVTEGTRNPWVGRC